MGFTYRMKTPSDDPALIQLWTAHSGWGKADERLWNHLINEGPYGEAAVVVAEEEETGNIVGQFPFVPSVVSIKGRCFSALRPFAPILAARARERRTFNPLNNPVLAMYRFAVKELRARGDALIYALPDPDWQGVLRFLPTFQSASFPYWSLQLPLAEPLPMPDGYVAAPLRAWDEQVDHLWEATSRLYDCLVVRDSRTLPWKIRIGDFTVAAVERDGELIGLATCLARKDGQWLISDILSSDMEDSLRATLAAACNLGHGEACSTNSKIRIKKAGILTVPRLEPALAAAGFRRESYDFLLAVHLLDPSIPKDAVAPERWYVSLYD